MYLVEEIKLGYEVHPIFVFGGFILKRKKDKLYLNPLLRNLSENDNNIVLLSVIKGFFCSSQLFVIVFSLLYYKSLF